MNSLQNVIALRPPSVAPELANAGSKSGYYLQYDPVTGWSWKHLNCLQKLIRWIFGSYQNTHSGFIKGQLQREAALPAAVRTRFHLLNAATPGLTAEPRALVSRILKIEEGDITARNVQCIVNAANPQLALLGADGIARRIYQVCGESVRQICDRMPDVEPDVKCRPGDAVATTSGNLFPRVTRIIHAVAPIYNPGQPGVSFDTLKRTYTSILQKCHQLGLTSIAIPSLGTGIYQMPFDHSTRLAYETIRDYIIANPTHFEKVELVFFNDGIHNRYADARRALRGLA